MADQNAHNTICDHLRLGSQARPIDLTGWRVNLANRWDGLTEARPPPPPPSSTCPRPPPPSSTCPLPPPPFLDMRSSPAPLPQHALLPHPPCSTCPRPPPPFLNMPSSPTPPSSTCPHPSSLLPQHALLPALPFLNPLGRVVCAVHHNTTIITQYQSTAYPCSTGSQWRSSSSLCVRCTIV